MPFTVTEFRDLISILEQHPEWRGELRNLVLTEGLLALPQTVQGLAEAQRRTEQEIAALAEAQRRTEERLERLEQTVAALAEAQRRTEERLEALAEAQRRTEERVEGLEAAVERLTEAQRRTEERLERLEQTVITLVETVTVLTRRVDSLDGRVRGWELEGFYRRRPFFFRSLVHRPRVLDSQEFTELLEEAVEAGRLIDWEANELALVDLVVRGYHRQEAQLTYLAVEIGWTVHTEDVVRAADRAGLLAQAVPPEARVIPVVAGREVSEAAEALARKRNVRLLRDSHVMPPA